MPIADKDRFNAIEQNIAYYDEVARSYNSIMEKDESNKIVRQKVRDKFLSIVKSGSVLDFGGGTGLDFDWLSTGDYDIFFCEPSDAMREKAIHYNESAVHNNRIMFLAPDKTNFRTWHSNSPFSTQLDAVLSNFGVLNYIPDIRWLFRSMAMVLKPGGHFLFVILHLNFRKRFQWHRRNALHSLVFGTTFKMYIPFKAERQTVFVYTPREIRRVSAEYFDYCEHENLESFDFTLLHLIRNEKLYQEVVNG